MQQKNKNLQIIKSNFNSNRKYEFLSNIMILYASAITKSNNFKKNPNINVNKLANKVTVNELTQMNL